MLDECFELAKELGNVPAGRWDALRVLCGHAVRDLGGRLRDGMAAGDCGPAFPLAAAWTALAGLCALDSMDGVESFTAGGVTIRQGGSAGERGNLLLRQAEALMTPYLEDREFFFRGVRG